MRADAVALHKILNGNLQMIIPIFQRSYSWETEQVQTLWDDIIKVYDSTAQNDKIVHFLGPIVRIEVTTRSIDTRKLYLIDGQQRIITLMILLACIRNVFKNKDDLVRKIESGYLLNYEEKEENEFKLVPSELDRENFKKIIHGIDGLTDSRLKRTFDYFTKELTESKKELNLERLRGIVINNLIIISIDMDKDENPYLIFEGLNAKGTPLTQADLIRNYIFMRIDDEEKQKQLYQDYWYPMETLLGDGLEMFFWRYSLREGDFVKIKRTYANLKSELEADTEKGVEKELKKLHEYSKYYSRLINPEKEPEEKLKSRFIRHNRWEIGTAYPFLLNIYKDYSENNISLNHFSEILDIIEAFVIRRFFCRYSSNKLNKLFVGLYKKLDKNNIVGSLRSSITDDCPYDIEFKEGLKKFPIYTSGSKKTSLILETLENALHAKEKVKFEGFEVEHILPQSEKDPERLPIEWKKMLGENYRKVYTTYIHTLGNLTLTGYNSELSARPFNGKKQYLRNSPLKLNRYFDNIEKWDEEEIIKRSELLTEIAVKTWRYAGISLF